MIQDEEVYNLECACGEIVSYYSKHGYYTAKNNKTSCYKCRNVKPKRRHSNIIITEWNRECPSCQKILYYSSKRNLDRAITSNSVCHSCRKPLTKNQIKKISKSLTGKKYPNRTSNTKNGKIEKYFRKCPECNTMLGYVSGYAFNRANKNNTICNSCSAKIYKKSWQYVIKDEHIKKMTATRAGYETFSQYMKDLDKKKKYYRNVRTVTKQQDISNLKNYDKLRGLCGINNAYQLDHIISISEGYNRDISPEIIGNIKNLQIIPWKDNLLKSNKNM